MIEFGEAYADQIVKNTRALGKYLLKYGFDVFQSSLGMSDSHQLVLSKEQDAGIAMKEELENVGIFVDALVRIGTAEVTRRGMKEEDMRYIAELMNRTINEKDQSVATDVKKMISNFQNILYCFSEDPLSKII
jgi:glycine hydroxymethyltransferase